MKKIIKSLLIFLTGLLVLLFISSPSFAQETVEQKAKKYGIAFPIKELGGCSHFQACKQYCADLEHKDACIAYAQAKGFYKEKVSQAQAEALTAAQSGLGCDSVASCQVFCEKPANQATCTSFSQKHGLSSPQATSYSESDAALFTKAKEALGCDSLDSCYALCEQEKNYTKCAGIAQQNISEEDKAMFEANKDQFKEFLGCDSIPTCMAFCINPLNTAKCMEFGSKQGFDSTQTSYESESGEPWCPKIAREGEVCAWDGNSCMCWNPSECVTWAGCTWTGSTCECTNSYTEEPGEVWCPKAAEAGQVCTWDGSQCTCFDPKACEQNAGCKWIGSTCDCTAANQYETPISEPGEVWCQRNPGCSWTGTSCECTSAFDTSAPTTVPPQVEGVSTKPTFFEKILLFIDQILPRY